MVNRQAHQLSSIPSAQGIQDFFVLTPGPGQKCRVANRVAADGQCFGPKLLDHFLDSNGEVEVRVGLGAAHASMDELSLIGVTVTLPGGMSAKIAVLGPMRMHYERVMTAVYNVGLALGSVG